MNKLATSGCETIVPSGERKPLKEIERSIITKYRYPVWSQFTKAIRDYQLIKEGDRVAVAISGGKDSLLMAKLFQELERHGKVKFEAKFIAMDPGYHPKVKELLLSNSEYLHIPLIIYESSIFDIVDNIANDYPCYMCAKMRRGSLYAKALELGCNKLALGHHFNDVIETTLLNLLCAGSFKTMMPKLKSKNFPGLELIRPMYYIHEESIEKFIRESGISPMNCACMVAAKKTGSKRYEIKNLIKEIKPTFQQVEKSIFRAAHNVQLDCIIGWKEHGKSYFFLEEYDEE
ncbi:MAG: tRNA 2-thiocytidine biosynthesis TtcA family protein [Peptococcales bacterium]|jgi:tRNA 2-thiocytidine biosynthesis protein TtcA